MNGLDLPTAGKLLIILGAVIALVGIALASGLRLPFGSLPGDFSGRLGNTRISVPLGTSILVSILATVILNIVLRR